jgi:hypothetical protein
MSEMHLRQLRIDTMPSFLVLGRRNLRISLLGWCKSRMHSPKRIGLQKSALRLELSSLPPVWKLPEPAAFELSVRRPLPGRRFEKKLIVSLKSLCAANAAAWATIGFTASGQYLVRDCRPS